MMHPALSIFIAFLWAMMSLILGVTMILWIRDPSKTKDSPLIGMFFGCLIFVASLLITRAGNRACARDEKDILAFVEKTLEARRL